MTKKRFSVEQIVAVLKQAELGLPVADLIRQVGISEQTFYRWKKQYDGLESDQVRELKQVVEENARLKKLVTELSLDKAVLQDVLSKSSPASAHEAGCWLCDGMSWLQRAGGPVPRHASIAPPSASRCDVIPVRNCASGCTRSSARASARAPAGPYPAEARRMEYRAQLRLPALQGGRSCFESQKAASPQDGGSSGRARRRDPGKPDLGARLRS